MRLGWIVNSLNVTIASTRYRAIYPAMALDRFGHTSKLYGSSEAALRDLETLDVLIFVKRLDADAPRLMTAATRKRIPFFVDICDNTLVSGYEKRSSVDQHLQLSGSSDLAAGIVTSTPAMAEMLQPHLSASASFYIVHDQIETEISYHEAAGFLKSHSPELAVPLEMEVSTGLSFEWIKRTIWRGYSFIHLMWTEPARAAYVFMQKLVPTKFAGRIQSGAPKVSAAMDQEPEQKHSAVPILLWFGNHGASHSNFGMLSLLQIAPALEKLSDSVEFQLLVISNNLWKYQNCIAPLRLRSRYVEWSPTAVFHALRRADVCLLPSTADEFSTVKSANRAVMALACSVPVVAGPLRALDPLVESGAVLIDNWEQNVRRLILDPVARNECTSRAAPVLERLYSSTAIGSQWDEILRRAIPRWPAARRGRKELRLGVVIDLLQDLDLLVPVIDRVKCDRRFALTVIVSDTVLTSSPRVLRAILERHLAPLVVPRRDVLARSDQAVRGLDALLTASESTAGPHKFNNILTILARSNGVMTFTLQHGLENIGLTYIDHEYGLNIVFESDHILTWGSPSALLSTVKHETRKKIIPVGRTTRTKEACSDEVRTRLAGRKVVGVFENLHWARYSNEYRERFITDLIAAARERTNFLFLLKPHHAGLFSVNHRVLLKDAPNNLFVINPKEPEWEPFTASALIPHCFAIITTPSSVALDAAEIDKPVAIAAYGLPLEIYRPLTQLQQSSDWTFFLDESLNISSDPSAPSVQFRDRVRLRGDATLRIAEALLDAATSPMLSNRSL